MGFIRAPYVRRRVSLSCPQLVPAKALRICSRDEALAAVEVTWGAKVNMGSRVTPKIFGVLLRGTSVLFRVTWGWAWYCLVHGVNRVTVDLSGAMRSLFSMDQSEIGAKSDWRRAERVETLREMSGWVTARVRSSA